MANSELKSIADKERPKELKKNQFSFGSEYSASNRGNETMDASNAQQLKTLTAKNTFSPTNVYTVDN